MDNITFEKLADFSDLDSMNDDNIQTASPRQSLKAEQSTESVKDQVTNDFIDELNDEVEKTAKKAAKKAVKKERKKAKKKSHSVLDHVIGFFKDVCKVVRKTLPAAIGTAITCGVGGFIKSLFGKKSNERKHYAA